MCGLFGIIRPSGILPEDQTALSRLGRQLKHRGPNGSGYISEPQVLLGMHRLSIMDPIQGWQPFWSEDERWGVLGNGEIYNAVELRRNLLRRGHSFRSKSDIEVVPHLMEEFGTSSFRMLRGMYALTIIDRRNGQVLLVRDPIGEKPLMYFREQGVIYISSEQSALLRSGLVPLQLRRSGLSSYLLHGFTPESESLVEGVRKVPSGWFVRVFIETGLTQEECYWSAYEQVGDNSLSDDEIASAIEDAVLACCTSDAPVGIALSGGLDSSVVAAIATQSGVDLSAFTVGYDARTSDESALARDLASSMGIPCQTITLRTESVVESFAQVCADRDEPISDLAGPAIHALPQAAREAGIPVLLTGIGGDELFWGYDWMRRLATWTTQLVDDRIRGSGVLGSYVAELPTTMQTRADWIISLGGVRTHLELERFARPNRDSQIPLPFYEFQPSYRAIRRAMTELGGTYPGPDRAEFMGHWDASAMGALYTIASIETYLKVNSLVQVDRLGMRHSVESRSPFADKNLVSTILSGRLVDGSHFLPPKQKLRSIAKIWLPAKVLARPKVGFTPPVRNWLRGIWAVNGSALDGDCLSSLTDLPRGAVVKGLRSPTTRSGRVNQMALRLLTLELWLRSIV